MKSWKIGGPPDGDDGDDNDSDDVDKNGEDGGRPPAGDGAGGGGGGPPSHAGSGGGEGSSSRASNEQDMFEGFSEKFLKMMDAMLRSQAQGFNRLVDNLHSGGHGVSKLPPLAGELPKFNGSQSLEAGFLHVEIFIKRMEFAMPSGTWADKQRLIGGIRALEGECLAQIRALPLTERDT